MDERQLTRVRVGDESGAWEAAGFTVTDGLVRLGSVAVEPVGSDGGRGIRSLALAGGRSGAIDGVVVDGAEAPTSATIHRNGVVSVDHLVIMTPDADRTTAALEVAGIRCRRVRTIPFDDGVRRQSFFWLGDVVLEVVGDDEAHGSGPARPWGLALVSDDLDATAAVLGDRCGEVKDAVQTGRRIATVRTRQLDISVPVALMSPHPR